MRRNPFPLPPPGCDRWTAPRKAAVLWAISYEYMSLAEIVRTYRLDPAEIGDWFIRHSQFGTAGLASTRLQEVGR